MGLGTSDFRKDWTDAGSGTTPRVFSATITENRSLDARSVRLVITLVCLASIVASLPFMILGAWPVAGFFGLDVLALFVAFRVNVARARGFEEVVVTPLEVLLRKVSYSGEERRWSFNPVWTKLESTHDQDFGMMRLMLVSRGVAVPVAAALSPPERETFAAAFTRALALARRGPEFDQG